MLMKRLQLKNNCTSFKVKNTIARRPKPFDTTIVRKQRKKQRSCIVNKNGNMYINFSNGRSVQIDVKTIKGLQIKNSAQIRNTRSDVLLIKTIDGSVFKMSTRAFRRKLRNTKQLENY